MKGDEVKDIQKGREKGRSGEREGKGKGKGREGKERKGKESQGRRAALRVLSGKGCSGLDWGGLGGFPPFGRQSAVGAVFAQVRLRSLPHPTRISVHCFQPRSSPHSTHPQFSLAALNHYTTTNRNKCASMSERGNFRGRGGGGGASRGGGERGRGGGGGGRGGHAQGPEKPKKENILDLAKYMDKEILVKFNGGRESELMPARCFVFGLCPVM